MPAKSKVTSELRGIILYLHSLGVSSPKIASLHLRDEVSRVTVWRAIQKERLKRMVSKHDVSDTVSDTVSLRSQIDHSQPALASSFNGGLGTPTVSQVLGYAIKQAGHGTLTRYDQKVQEVQLRRFVGGKDSDRVLGQVREHLKNRSELLFGFNGNSDKDTQFADLNDLAKFLIRAKGELDGKVKLRPKQLVDALLITIFGEKARGLIEGNEKHLHCPRCRKARSYVLDKDPAFYLCLSCGKQIATEKARFKVTLHRVDARYLRTVERLLGRSSPILPEVAAT